MSMKAVSCKIQGGIDKVKRVALKYSQVVNLKFDIKNQIKQLKNIFTPQERREQNAHPGGADFGEERIPL